MRRRRLSLPMALIAGALATPAWAANPGKATGAAGPEERARQSAEIKALKEFERAVNRVRAKKLGSVRVRDIRKSGMEEVSDLLDGFVRAAEGAGDPGAPARAAADAYASLLEIFEREDEDVRIETLRLIGARASDQSAAALAWSACHDDSPGVRDEALALLKAREGSLGAGAMGAIAEAIRSRKDEIATAGAQAASALRLVELIPALITAQVAPGGTGGGGDGGGRTGPRAFIFVGVQRNFVSDLTPVVGTSSVAFDPTVSTLNTGALLVIHDALVTSYRSEVHEALVRLSSEAFGRSTEYLGYDLAGWASWWETQMRPMLAAGGVSAPPAPTVVPGAYPPPPAPIVPEMILVPTGWRYCYPAWWWRPGLPPMRLPVQHQPVEQVK